MDWYKAKQANRLLFQVWRPPEAGCHPCDCRKGGDFRTGRL